MQNVNPDTKTKTGFAKSIAQGDKSLFGTGLKRKILFVVTQSEMGGAQRFLLETLPCLAQQSYKVILAAGGNNNKEFSIFKNQFSINFQSLNLKHLKRMPLPYQAYLSVKEIKQLLKQEKPDTLFLCSTMAGILGSIAGKSFRRQGGRVIYRIGGWAFNDPRPYWQKKFILCLEKYTAKFKDKIIVNSQYDFDCALKHKIAPENKLIKIYNGLDPETIQFLPRFEARKKLSLPQDKIIIGTIANFYKTKGLEYLIEASRNFQFSSANFQTIIIGNGIERKSLEKLIKKHNLQNKISLLGKKPEARKYLKAFDLFALPSLKEGFPWVLLESMAAEVPIVATKVGAVPEIIENNQSGFVVEPKNSKILAKKIQELASNSALQNKFSQNAKEKLKQFSSQKMTEQIKDLL